MKELIIIDGKFSTDIVGIHVTSVLRYIIKSEIKKVRMCL